MRLHKNQIGRFISLMVQLVQLTPKGFSVLDDLSWLFGAELDAFRLNESLDFSEDFTHIAYDIGLRITNLELQACCVDVEVGWDKNGNMVIPEFAFSPDAKFIAISELSVNTMDERQGYLRVYDAETATLIDEISYDDWREAGNDHPAALHVRWIGDNIKFAPHCWYCETSPFTI